MKKIKVLILDDMETDYNHICASIEKISNSLKDRGVELTPFYADYQSARNLIANYVAYKNMPVHLQEQFKKEAEKEVEEIKKENDLISIIDIRWELKNGQHGADFYSEYYNCFNHKNSLIVTIVNKKKVPSNIKDIETITKSDPEPFGDKFDAKLKKAILNMPIVRENLLPGTVTPPPGE